MFASHLHVTGARTSTEKEIHVSSNYATDPAHLDPAYGYLAFGHIHVPQPVAGGRGRYAGSILEVDFGETGEAKQVGVVDLEPGRPTAITSVPLTRGRRLHKVRAPLSTLTEHAGETRGGIVEVTVAPEPGNTSPVDRHAAIDVDGRLYDTLSQAVRALLPDVTIVGVVDARNTDVELAEQVPVTDAAETFDGAFADWFREHGDRYVRERAHADPVRITELFAELRAGVGAAAADAAPLREELALREVTA